VINHIDDLDRFFSEAERVLVPAGILVVATDSEETLRRRSLTVFFPEILQVELGRYPTIAHLRTAATAARLLCTREERVEGWIPLDPDYIAKLEAKCASSMRPITPQQHATGMGRVRAAAARGELWLSCYDLLRYARPPRAGNRWQYHDSAVTWPQPDYAHDLSCTSSLTPACPIPYTSPWTFSSPASGPQAENATISRPGRLIGTSSLRTPCPYDACPYLSRRSSHDFTF
jgi:hypothetical protein